MAESAEEPQKTEEEGCRLFLRLMDHSEDWVTNPSGMSGTWVRKWPSTLRTSDSRGAVFSSDGSPCQERLNITGLGGSP